MNARCLRPPGRTLGTLTLALALAVPLQAGGITRSGGVLGDSVTYDLSGNAGIIYAFLPSLTQGPTPLAIFDPSDLRVMDVGLDLIDLLTISVFDGAGQSQVSFPLPAAPTLQGLVLYSQLVEVPLAPTFFGDLSAQNAVTLGLPGSSAPTAFDNVFNHVGHTATLLDDGRVLVTGGNDYDDQGNENQLRAIVIYDPQTECFTQQLNDLTTERGAHGAIKLQDGKVLISGGANAANNAIPDAEIWDPATGMSTLVAPMTTGRALPSMVLLNDGRVFVSGGVANYNSGDIVGSLASAKRETEVYNPVNDTWTPGPLLPKGRAGHGASLLGDGLVLLTGGLEVTVIFGVPIPEISNDCRRYDPVTNTLLATAPFNGNRALHGQVALPNGNALIAGGAFAELITLSVQTFASTRVYDFQSNTWTDTADMNEARGFPQLVLAGNATLGHKVACLAGIGSADINGFNPSAAVETAPVTISAWTQHQDMVQLRTIPLSTVIEDGTRILTTGAKFPEGSLPVNTAEIFNVP